MIIRAKSAEIALGQLPTTASRLDAALAAKASADQAAIDKSAERGCRENCRALLQAQVDAAATEIEQARVELGKGRITAEGELTTASKLAGGSQRAVVAHSPCRSPRHARLAA